MAFKKLMLLSTLLFVSGFSCGDRLSSTHPKMDAFVSEHGFAAVQKPNPANLGPSAPWYGIATKSGAEYILIIYPTTSKLYTVKLGVNGRLTRSQMAHLLTSKGYQQVDKRLWLNGQSNHDNQVVLLWALLDKNGFRSESFYLNGAPIPQKGSHKESVYSFQG